MKKAPMSFQISQYVKNNPTAKAADVAKALNTTAGYVYTVTHNMKKKTAKKQTITKEVIAKRMELAKAEGEKKMEEAKRIWQKPKTDNVNHPAHYKVGGVETIDFIEAKSLNYNLGNVVKYITRAGHKNDLVEDLKKARWYLNREISKLDGAEQ